MGLHPDELGQLPYPEFARYLSYYSDPEQFLNGFFDKGDAVDKLVTFHSVQQDLIRQAEKRKQSGKD